MCAVVHTENLLLKQIWSVHSMNGECSMPAQINMNNSFSKSEIVPVSIKGSESQLALRRNGNDNVMGRVVNEFILIELRSIEFE